MKTKYIFTLFVIVTIVSCSEFTYTEFDRFYYKKAAIDDNTEINILTFSGGKDCTTETTYYYSVIAVVANTKDTVRILTPCQLFSVKFSNGVYHKENALQDSLLKVAGVDLMGKEKYVVINSGLPFQDGNYPVAIGSIGFADDKSDILKADLKEHDIDTNLIEGK